MAEFGFIEGEIEEARGLLLGRAKVYCPSRSSRGRDSLHLQGNEVWGNKYLRYVIGGTDAHPIAAHQPPKALAFLWHGRDVFFRSVHHPGTRANDFRIDAIRDAAQMARPLLRAAGVRILGELKARIEA